MIEHGTLQETASSATDPLLKILRKLAEVFFVCFIDFLIDFLLLLALKRGKM